MDSKELVNNRKILKWISVSTIVFLTIFIYQGGLFTGTLIFLLFLLFLITIILGFDLYTWIFKQEKPGKESLILLVLSILLYSFFGIYDGPKTVNVLLVLFSLAVSVVIVLEMAIQIKLRIFKS